MDDTEEFRRQGRRWSLELAADPEVTAHALDLLVQADRHHWTYQWTWLGLPIIQMPPDIVVMQEIIWAQRPDLIIETGVARGGSLVLSASILQLLGDGAALGIDIDIRAHNRAAIENHPLAHRIELIEGSSVDHDLVAQVRRRAGEAQRVMVILDSNHTHEHVLDELNLYADLVTPGQYLVVADTVVEDLPPQDHRPRPWGKGDNPATALREWGGLHPEFEADDALSGKLLLTSSPGGYLRRRPTDAS